jgi:acetylornithine/N-succinyldiaminopimelate aminotransferase
MLGVETEKPASEVVKECIKKGVLCLTAKTKVRLLPALNISDKQLKKALEIIKSVCAE